MALRTLRKWVSQPLWNKLMDSPRIHEFLQEMNREVLSKCELHSLYVSDPQIPTVSLLARQ
jgi:hypothetical protein